MAEGEVTREGVAAVPQATDGKQNPRAMVGISSGLPVATHFHEDNRFVGCTGARRVHELTLSQAAAATPRKRRSEDSTIRARRAS